MKYTLNESFLSKETPESFYVAGFLAADGWVKVVQKKNTKYLRYDVCLSLKEEDKEHLEKIKILFETDKPLYKRLVRNSLRNPKYNDTITYSLNLYSKNIFDDLRKFNVTPNKSLTYQFPDWLLNHKYVNHFMRGYFDGDGSISFDSKNRKTPQARLHIRGTKNFLESFHQILSTTCGLDRNKVIGASSNIGSLQYTGNKNVYKIMSFLYQDSPIYLERKFQKYQSLSELVGI